MDWSILIPVGIILLALLIFLIVRNNKDRKNLENKLNQDYRKPKDEEGEMDRGADEKI